MKRQRGFMRSGLQSTPLQLCQSLIQTERVTSNRDYMTPFMQLVVDVIHNHSHTKRANVAF